MPTTVAVYGDPGAFKSFEESEDPPEGHVHTSSGLARFRVIPPILPIEHGETGGMTSYHLVDCKVRQL